LELLELLELMDFTRLMELVGGFATDDFTQFMPDLSGYFDEV
jgi:hypothetical protein